MQSRRLGKSAIHVSDICMGTMTFGSQADEVTALVIENNAGTLTAYSMGAAPSAAITVQCTVTEVGA